MMIDKKYSSINIACSDIKIAKALARYLTYCFGFEKILLNPLKDPYKIRESLEMAEQSDFLVVDAFIDGEPRGFKFARQVGKKTLLLFYPGELDIEDEGSFWLVLPFKLLRLKKKIKELMQKSAPIDSNYNKLEKIFSKLRETKEHHE